ncbi:amidase, partial [Mesorhizobium sp.]
FVVCRTVRDMAAALDVFSGPHPGDPFIIVQPSRPYVDELSRPTGTLRVGVARTYWGAFDLDPEILQAVEKTAALLEEMGHEVREMDPPYEPAEKTKIALGGGTRFANSLDAAARAMGRTINSDTLEPFNLKVYERSRNAPPDSIATQLEDIRKFRFRVGVAIDPFDILMTPTMPMVAPPHGGIYCTTNPNVTPEEYSDAGAADGAAATHGYMGVFNITGHPSVSLPLAQSATGLPIGLQIVGRFGDEATLVRISRDLEEACPWRHRQPSVRAGRS